MGGNKLETSDITLEQVEAELQELLNSVKPLDKVKKGNKYVTEKDWDINGFQAYKKWQTIEVLRKIKPLNEWQTTTIVYSVDWDREYDLADGIFMATFCPDLVIEDKNYAKKLKDLRQHEKDLKKALESDWLDHKVELEKLSTFKKVTKILMKKLGL